MGLKWGWELKRVKTLAFVWPATLTHSHRLCRNTLKFLSRCEYSHFIFHSWRTSQWLSFLFGLRWWNPIRDDRTFTDLSSTLIDAWPRLQFEQGMFPNLIVNRFVCWLLNRCFSPLTSDSNSNHRMNIATWQLATLKDSNTDLNWLKPLLLVYTF